MLCMLFSKGVMLIVANNGNQNSVIGQNLNPLFKV